MSDDVQTNDQEIEAAEERTPLTSSKSNRFSTTRELTEKELARPESVQFLLKEIERLENEVVRLEEYRERFHEADKAKLVLDQRLQVSIAKDIVFTVNVAIGLALFGILPSVWSVLTTVQNLVGFGFALVLVISGVVAKCKAA